SGVGVCLGIGESVPARPGTDLGRRERRAFLDHVPGRADAEHESDREGADEIGERAHRMAARLHPWLRAGRGETKWLIWQDAGQAVVVLRLEANKPLRLMLGRRTAIADG